MRRISYILLILGIAAGAWAFDWKTLKPQGYVSDFAGVVDPASRQELERYCAAVERQTGAQIALVTLRSLEGEPVEDVANTIFRAWGVGQKGHNNGILLLLSIADRRSRLEVGYELEPSLPDGFSGGILREMRPALRANQYGEAFLAAAHHIGSVIAQAKGVQIDTEPRRRIQRDTGGGFPWPILLGVFILFLLMSQGGSSGGLLSGMLMGQVLGRYPRGYHRGGGGFGGYDSGGGFGGFGGGDSGGGGASSNW
jgi:uncharacterized protein